MPKKMKITRDKSSRTIAVMRPDLLEEWDWEKNAELGLDPYKLTVGSNKRANWVCSKGHTWDTVIQSRVNSRGCPFCFNGRVLAGFNDLATTHPELVAEWDYEANEKLPSEVGKGSNYKASWICAKCGNRYEMTVNGRALRGSQCPPCARKERLNPKTIVKPNESLADIYPAIAAEWHPTKNGDAKPSDFRPHSNKKVWWMCQFGHEWEAVINNRTGVAKRGCPTCVKYMRTSFPEQAIFYYVSQAYADAVNGADVMLGGLVTSFDIWVPSIRTAIEYDGEHWHTDASRDASKDRRCFDNGVRLIRVCEPGCAVYSDVISTTRIERSDRKSKSSLNSCIREVLNILGSDIDVNVDIDRDEYEIRTRMVASRVDNSFGENFPELAKEWHPTKNGGLTPYMVAQHSGIKAWFVCSEGHEYQMAICDRSYGESCYKCAMKELGRKKMVPEPGKSFADVCPDAARAWHPTKNGDMTPFDVKPNSNKVFWWRCESCGHEWSGMVQKRAKAGSPLCRACVMADLGKKRTITHEKFVEAVGAANPNVEVIGTYVQDKERVLCRCKKCGNEWYAYPGNLKKGHGCNECAKDIRRQTRRNNRLKKLEVA